MTRQNVDDYITHVASKILSAVEVDKFASNQHELNGVSNLRAIFGSDSSVAKKFRTTFAYLSDNDQSCTSQEGFMTWYDARADHPTRSEFRLYYSENAAFASAKPSDQIFIIQKSDGTYITAICERGSSIESQVNWLLGLKERGKKFTVKDIPKEAMSYPARFVMDLIGVEIQTDSNSDIDELLTKYKEFPTCAEFSAFARSFIDDDAVNAPDTTLVAWMKKEDEFFKALEKHIIIETINSLSEDQKAGIDEDDLVGRYISTSLSIQNRRKARAGQSFEQHLKELFDRNKVSYSYQAVTEGHSKPDFIMPSINLYRDPMFDASRLTMLGAKTTCKDRWRQVLGEADRIPIKHLATIEPAISVNQCEEMIARDVQLVVPKPIIQTYSEQYRDKVWTMEKFIGYALEKQSV